MIDGHLHVWSDDPGRYPWQPIYGATPPSLPGSVEFVLGVLERHGVRVAIAVQTRVYGDDHRYLLDARARFPDRIVAVAALDPSDPAAPDRLAELAAAGVRGLRLDPMGWSGPWLADGTVLPLWDAAARLGLAVELMIRPDQLPALAVLAERKPAMPVVIEHLARYGVDSAEPLESLLALARLPNLHAKVSGLDSISREPPPHRDLWPLLAAVVEAFGPQRLMWGSDMPWIGEAGYGPALATVERLPFLDRAGRSWLRGDTARAVLDLS